MTTSVGLHCLLVLRLPRAGGTPRGPLPSHVHRLRFGLRHWGALEVGAGWVCVLVLDPKVMVATLPSQQGGIQQVTPFSAGWPI